MCCARCGVCALSRTPGLIKAADCSLPSHLWETSGSHPGLTGTAGVGGFLLPPLSRDSQAPVAAPSPGPACFLPRRARSAPSKWNSLQTPTLQSRASVGPPDARDYLVPLSACPSLCQAAYLLFGKPWRCRSALPASTTPGSPTLPGWNPWEDSGPEPAAPPPNLFLRNFLPLPAPKPTAGLSLSSSPCNGRNWSVCNCMFFFSFSFLFYVD